MSHPAISRPAAQAGGASVSDTAAALRAVVRREVKDGSDVCVRLADGRAGGSLRATFAAIMRQAARQLPTPTDSANDITLALDALQLWRGSDGVADSGIVQLRVAGTTLPKAMWVDDLTLPIVRDRSAPDGWRALRQTAVGAEDYVIVPDTSAAKRPRVRRACLNRSH